MKRILLSILAFLVFVILVFALNLIVFLNKASKITEGDPIPEYKTEKPALLVVDLQFCTTGEISSNEHYKENSEELISNVNLITELSDQQSIPVIYIRNVVKNPLVNVLNNTMAEGSAGSSLDDRLVIVSDHQVTKERKDAFSNPQLDSILLQNEINRLYLVGLDAAHCVNSTIQAAQNRQYKVSVITDAVLSKSDEMKNEMLHDYTERGIVLLSTLKFIEQLNNSSKEESIENIYP